MGKSIDVPYMDPDGMAQLCVAIVKQAIDDYRRAFKTLARDPGNLVADSELKRIKKFFHGKWYAQLMEVDPKIILKKLSEEERQYGIHHKRKQIPQGHG